MQQFFAALSDVGCVRAQNEDAYVAEGELTFYLVADGMGGHAGGKTAADMVASLMREWVASQAPQPPQQALEQGPSSAAMDIAEQLRRASRAVYDKAAADPELAGMGTTTTLLWCRDERGIIAHVGDSRCYLLRAGELTQLTDDHSLINEQVRMGLLTAEEAQTSKMRNVITRSVGFEPDVAVDLIELELQPEDLFLLCSDGLTNHLKPAEIAAILRANPLAVLPKLLVQQACERGGEDNITVVCVQMAATAGE